MKKIYLLLALLSLAYGSVQAQGIIINEVYGGGGNSGATIKQDFVELVNKSTATVSLTGAYLQYASATGTFNASNVLALPDITLEPGQFYLIQLAQGNGGTLDLLNPDFVPTGNSAPGKPLVLSGSTGKIALTSDATLVSSVTDPNVIDFVGWGTTASLYKGTGPAPRTTNSTSISRDLASTNNNDNSTDFTAGKPTPKNSLGQTTPVRLVSFTANAIAGANLLSWQTAEEKNLQSFIVLRSNNLLDWSSIATLNAKGIAHTYTYTDATTLGYYYQLKIVNIDGSFNLSPIVSLPSSEAFIEVKLYPNPVKDILILELPARAKNLSINIYNTLGKKVLSHSGLVSSINLSSLAKGVYFVQLLVDGITVTKQIVKH